MFLNQKFPHGIMFHDFHEKNEYQSQGSLTLDSLEKIIKFIGRENILDADDFHQKLISGKISKREVCFTFDDALNSQYGLALNVLEAFNIKAYFFIPTLIFSKTPPIFQIEKKFIFTVFSDVKDFYNKFYENLDTKNVRIFFLNNKKKILDFKKRFPFYSYSDIRYRLIRDIFLSREEYNKIMNQMFMDYSFDVKKQKELIHMNEQKVKDLVNKGHSVGLHSHSHKSTHDTLSFKDQKKEYSNNMNTLCKIGGINKNKIHGMSHPYGKYNDQGIKALEDLEIKVGFLSNDSDKNNYKSFLHIPRYDCITILKNIQK